MCKSAVLWEVMPCSLVEVFQCFTGTYCLCHQGRWISFSHKMQGGPCQSSGWPVGARLEVSVQENKWGLLKELVMSGLNHCFSNLGPLFISCERLFTGSPLPFFLFSSPVSLTWKPLSFPPRTRSLYTLRPTAKVLLQANFWKTLGREGSCPCWT